MYTTKSCRLLLGFYLLSLSLFWGCKDKDEPEKENPEEEITYVKLTFSPKGTGKEVVVEAEDKDGKGPKKIEASGTIVLQKNTTYDLAIRLENRNDKDDVENVTEEIEEEADEHMFFFAFTEGLFAKPPGNGNIDNREDGAVIYLDHDGEDDDNKGEPLGLKTQWETGDAKSGKDSKGNDLFFRVVLKHQPDLKSATSTSETGGTDFDFTWKIEIK